MTTALLRLIRPKRFTGFHMLAVMLAFYGVIVSVNLTMATLANTTWTGLLNKNGYVASIDYAKLDAAEQTVRDLGWNVTLTEDLGVVRLDMTDATNTVIPATVSASVRNAFNKFSTLEFVNEGGVYTSTPSLPAGAYTVNILIDTPDTHIEWPAFIDVKTQ